MASKRDSSSWPTPSSARSSLSSSCALAGRCKRARIHAHPQRADQRARPSVPAAPRHPCRAPTAGASRPWGQIRPAGARAGCAPGACPARTLAPLPGAQQRLMRAPASPAAKSSLQPPAAMRICTGGPWSGSRRAACTRMAVTHGTALQEKDRAISPPLPDAAAFIAPAIHHVPSRVPPHAPHTHLLSRTWARVAIEGRAEEEEALQAVPTPPFLAFTRSKAWREGWERRDERWQRVSCCWRPARLPSLWGTGRRRRRRAAPPLLRSPLLGCLLALVGVRGPARTGGMQG